MTRTVYNSYVTDIGDTKNDDKNDDYNDGGGGGGFDFHRRAMDLQSIDLP